MDGYSHPGIAEREDIMVRWKGHEGLVPTDLKHAEDGSRRSGTDRCLAYMQALGLSELTADTRSDLWPEQGFRRCPTPLQEISAAVQHSRVSFWHSLQESCMRNRGQHLKALAFVTASSRVRLFLPSRSRLRMNSSTSSSKILSTCILGSRTGRAGGGR